MARKMEGNNKKEKLSLGIILILAMALPVHNGFQDASRRQGSSSPGA
ncbi:hypothetical protein Xekk_01675 [Xenorhabdus sp. KK7.4]|nr:hypothetical protein Xekk_01675 [Xenorhabdus sp. KK7.4]